MTNETTLEKKQISCMCGNKVTIPVKATSYFCGVCDMSKSVGDEEYEFVSDQARSNILLGKEEVILGDSASGPRDKNGRRL